MRDSLKIAIAGATGYVGLELVKILSRHPKVEIIHLCAKKSIGKSIYQIDNRIKRKHLPKISKISNIDFRNIDIVFSALPDGDAHALAKKLQNKTKLIDLSADFRIYNPEVYKKWYGINHNGKSLINKSIYAIAEFSKKRLKNYKIISCPGCYPTSIQIPLIPLVENKLINFKNIIIDSKSGFSGAGKNIKKKFKFKNLFDSVSAYGIGKHRHMAEIDQELSRVAKKKIEVHFTPHLIPMFRGILSTMYLEMNKNLNAKKIYDFLKKYHKENPFVKVQKFNVALGTGEVVNTNYCKIGIFKDRIKNKVIIISVLDNLIKGASGQAVQNMNLAYNFNETLGLK